MSRLLNLGLRLGTKLFTTGTGLATLGTAGTIGVGMQYAGFGTAENFFHHSFVTTKSPEAIVDFYSTEEFLQILGVIPLGLNLILAGVTWDDNRDNAMNVWNMMEISFDITEKEIEMEDGKKVVAFFNKRERFVNYFPFTSILMWDQTQNYGYRRRSDGSMEVMHHGEKFYGPWPVRFAVQLHAKYVIWATEKHINSELFGTEDLEAVEEQRANIPLHAFKEWMAELQANQEQAIKQARLKKQDTTRAEANLAKLKTLKSEHVTVTTKNRLNRTTSRIDVADPEAQKAIKDALGVVSKMKGGKEATEKLHSMLQESATKVEKKAAVPAAA